MSKIRYVKNQEPIAVMGMTGRTPHVEDGVPMVMTLSRYVREYLVNDPRFATTRAMSHRAYDIADAFRDEDAPYYKLEQACWSLLKDTADMPGKKSPDDGGQNFMPAFFYRQMRPFNDAICEALDTEPKDASTSPAKEPFEATASNGAS